MGSRPPTGNLVSPENHSEKEGATERVSSAMCRPCTNADAGSEVETGGDFGCTCGVAAIERDPWCPVHGCPGCGGERKVFDELVLEMTACPLCVPAPVAKPESLGAAPIARKRRRSAGKAVAVVCPGCSQETHRLDPEWGLCLKCTGERAEREALAANPGVTHGKGGVPELPVVPTAPGLDLNLGLLRRMREHAALKDDTELPLLPGELRQILVLLARSSASVPAADPGATHGKGGVPELSAVPESATVRPSWILVAGMLVSWRDADGRRWTGEIVSLSGGGAGPVRVRVREAGPPRYLSLPAGDLTPTVDFGSVPEEAEQPNDRQGGCRCCHAGQPCDCCPVHACDGCRPNKERPSGYLCPRCAGERRRVLRGGVLLDAMEGAWERLAESPGVDPVTVAICKGLRDAERGL